jgi:ribosomal protein L5
MLYNSFYYSKIFNYINEIEQIDLIKYKHLYKLKINIFLKNREKNKLLFVVNLLLLERTGGQRIYFIMEKINSFRIKSIKIGCNIILRNENLFNFLRMFIFTSFPKLRDYIFSKNRIENKFEIKEQKLLFIKFNKFLFFSIFSFFVDFDKFLTYYENSSYYLNIELYTGFHKFLLNRLSFSLYGLQTL